MSVRRIREVIGKTRDVDLLWSDYCRTTSNPDPSQFATWLNKHGHLDDKALRDILTDREVSFTLSEGTKTLHRDGVSSRHELLALLGRGAMGEVHIAKDPDLNRNVAVKLMDPALGKDAVLARRFLTEVQITAQLDHPGIVPVYSIERQSDGTVGYSMRIIKGRTLEQYIEDIRGFYEKRQTPDDDHNLQARLRIFTEIANAIDYAHSRGVIHRDLKPENIMVGKFGEVIVMDWGVARLMGTAEDPSASSKKIDDQAAPGATQIGMAVGTPAYMSPEQAQGKNRELDGRSDQYSLGLILFELVTLKRGIAGKTVYEVMVNATDGERQPTVHAYGEYIPRELKAIIAKATAYEPKDRYPTVDAMADDIRRFLRDEEIRAQPDTGTQRIQRWISRHRQGTMMIGMGLVTSLFVGGASAVLVGTGLFLVQRHQAELRQERLANALSVVSGRGHQLDSRFSHYQGELVGLIAATEQALRDPTPPPVQTFWAPAFKGVGTPPPDLAPSKSYDVDASLDYPDNVAAPTSDAAKVALQLQQLNNLQPLMYDMLVRSNGPDARKKPKAEQRRMILEEGAPLVWVYMATEEGLLTGMPGTGDYPEQYDPREQDWYRNAKARDAIGWSTEEDESGQGMVVTASGPIYGVDGATLAIGALDLKVNYVAHAMLLPPEFPGVDAMLLDPGGVIMTSSNPAYKEKQSLPDAALLAAVQASPAGHLEHDGRLDIWTRLDVIGWTYLVSGTTDQLIR